MEEPTDESQREESKSILMYMAALEQVKAGVSDAEIGIDEMAAALYRFSGDADQAVLYLQDRSDPRIWSVGRQIQERDRLLLSNN